MGKIIFGHWGYFQLNTTIQWPLEKIGSKAELLHHIKIHVVLLLLRLCILLIICLFTIMLQKAWPASKLQHDEPPLWHWLPESQMLLWEQESPSHPPSTCPRAGVTAGMLSIHCPLHKLTQ